MIDTVVIKSEKRLRSLTGSFPRVSNFVVLLKNNNMKKKNLCIW